MIASKYIADVSYDADMLLDDWEWLLKGQYSPWFVTKFGDVFLKDKSLGSVAWLDVMSGAVTTVAADEKSFNSLAEEPENLDRWFMPEVVNGQATLGMLPGKNQCISFIKPPVLGGEVQADNFELTDASMHLSIAGQIHKQVKDLPLGTKISRILFESSTEAESKKPWWRLW